MFDFLFSFSSSKIKFSVVFFILLEAKCFFFCFFLEERTDVKLILMKTEEVSGRVNSSLLLEKEIFV